MFIKAHGGENCLGHRGGGGGGVVWRDIEIKRRA